jgi:hypothetical protein
MRRVGRARECLIGMAPCSLRRAEVARQSIRSRSNLMTNVGFNRIRTICDFVDAVQPIPTESRSSRARGVLNERVPTHDIS